MAAVRGLCQELAESHDLRVQFDSRGSIDVVPADVALCLYRIAQEALRNVVKHSGSTSAAVALDSTAEDLVLRVSDHGRGFDPASKEGRGGLGLLSMRERLRLVGGELSIVTQACGGTRVEARVPQPAPFTGGSDGCGAAGFNSPVPCRGCLMKPPRVLIADDHRMLREIFAQLLEPHCDVVGQSADGRALLADAERLRPDIVVLDVSMPLLNGLDAARQLKRTMPDVKVIFLTASEDHDLAAEAFRAGASGFLLKNSAASELLSAITEAQQGRSYVTPQSAQALVEGLLHNEHKDEEQLSPRQREVLQLLAEGHTMKEIAKLLSITPRTVAFHKYTAMKDLGISTNAELIQFALEHRLVAR